MRSAEVEALRGDLEDQRQAVDALADGLDVALFVCDGQATVRYANRRAQEVFGFDRPAGRLLLEVTLSPPLEALVRAAATTGSAQPAEVSFGSTAERVGQAKAWTQSQRDGRVFLSLYEITDLRRLERIRQDFVSNVSHELRTPLTIIRAQAETLLDAEEPDPPLSQRYLSNIVAEVDRLSTMSQDLLVLSAAESNPVRKQACNVAEVLREASSGLQGQASEKGLRLTLEAPERCMVEANEAQMRQVALNLVENAINYTLRGDVEVSLKCGGQRAEIKVRDTGIGIAAEHLPRVFERFYRVDKGRSRSTGGTGLGLSIVRHIVEAHGGKVRVESALNVGSTFTISLPVGDPPSGESA